MVLRTNFYQFTADRNFIPYAYHTVTVGKRHKMTVRKQVEKFGPKDVRHVIGRMSKRVVWNDKLRGYYVSRPIRYEAKTKTLFYEVPSWHFPLFQLT